MDQKISNIIFTLFKKNHRASTAQRLLQSRVERLFLSLLWINNPLEHFHHLRKTFNQIFFKDITDNLSFKLKSFALKYSFEAASDDKVRLTFFFFFCRISSIWKCKLVWERKLWSFFFSWQNWKASNWKKFIMKKQKFPGKVLVLI